MVSILIFFGEHHDDNFVMHMIFRIGDHLRSLGMSILVCDQFLIMKCNKYCIAEGAIIIIFFFLAIFTDWCPNAKITLSESSSASIVTVDGTRRSSLQNVS